MLRCLIVLISVVSISKAGYVDGHSGNDIGNGGNSYGYGYSGSFSGSGPPQNFGVPQFGDFQGFLNSYLGNLAKYHEEFMRNIQAAATQGHVGGLGGGGGGYGGSFGIGNRGSFGGSFAGPQTSAGGSSYGTGFGTGTGGAFGGSFSGPGTPPLGNGASASAFFGPGGVHQTASVYPENPTAPNINTRFGAAPSQGDGFYSVFTSSQSETSNLNGKPVTVNRATTTVNDNGKVTTYTAKNP